MTAKPFYVTTAISYPNGAPHIGHAYEMIATDAIARWARLEGKDVFFLTGTDEHGLKMAQTAAAAGIPVRDLAERNSGRFKDLAKALTTFYDNDACKILSDDRALQQARLALVAACQRVLANTLRLIEGLLRLAARIASRTRRSS